MLDWIKTRSKRDLVLALAVAGGFVFLVGTFVMRRADHRVGGGHAVAEYAFSGGVAFDQEFDVRAGGQLEIRVGDADVSVASSGSDARVILHMDGEEISAADLLADLGFEVRASERGLTIRTEDRDWGWRDHDEADLRLEVWVPQEFDISVQTGDGDVAVDSFDGEISVQTGDGDVAVGMAYGAWLRVQTGDGDVALAGAESRDISIQTGDGDVAAQRLDGETVHIRTGDGDILLQEMGGEFRASTGDGDVQVHLTRFDGLNIRTGDGDVTIYAPAGISADVDFTGSDFVIGEAFALPVKLDSRRLQGPLNGGGPSLSVRVGDGTIQLIER